MGIHMQAPTQAPAPTLHQSFEKLLVDLMPLVELLAVVGALCVLYRIVRWATDE